MQKARLLIADCGGRSELDSLQPVAVRNTRGAWYRSWRLVSLDGSALDVADEDAFSRPGASRGASAYPQIRFVSLAENGTHVLSGSQMEGYRTGEITLAKAVLPRLRKFMLCLADQDFLGFELWQLFIGCRRLRRVGGGYKSD